MSPRLTVPGCTLGRLLGEGATGAVYEATNASGEALAIKFLHESFSDEPAMVARFKREAQTCQRLRSPHIASVVGAGRSGDAYWIAYRRLRGETLADRLKRERVLAADVAAAPIEHVLLGLAVAHEANVVHRDVKPANIMLEPTTSGESACLMDFGCSKDRSLARSTGSQSLTSATSTLGTINYMPPEQIGASAAVDRRADLYATGVVAYRAITGRLPYVGTSQAVVMQAKLSTDARSLSEATSLEWPEAFEGFFRRALSRDPAGRHRTAEEMRDGWRGVIATAGGPTLRELRGLGGSEGDGENTVLDGPPSGVSTQ